MWTERMRSRSYVFHNAWVSAVVIVLYAAWVYKPEATATQSFCKQFELADKTNSWLAVGPLFLSQTYAWQVPNHLSVPNLAS